MRKTWIVVGCVFMVAGCSQHSRTLNTAALSNESTLKSLRAKADPEMLANVKAQEAAAMSAQGTQSVTSSINAMSLPVVSQALFAPSAEQVASGDTVVSPVKNQQPTSSEVNAAQISPERNDFSRPQVATYGGGYGGGSSLIPPPPAVSLATQAQPMVYGMTQEGQATQVAYEQPDMSRVRNPGSLFDPGARASDSNDSDSHEVKKHVNFTAITPTGMEARSPYKQKDDLRLLWKGMTSSRLQNLVARDERLSRIEPKLPGEASKGAFNVTQRQVDTIFKNPALDKRTYTTVKQSQVDLVQAYYRYLYAFNKYALAQQTITARKQEIAYADSASEAQRATTDLSSAQSDAESARDDLKAAQYELASAAGPQSARLVIGRVSGVAPNADSLVLADSGDSASDNRAQRSSRVGSIFRLRKDKEVKEAPEVVAEAPAAEEKAKPKKKGKFTPKIVEDPDDLQPAPEESAADNKVSHMPSISGAISFKLNNVDISPRKSVLKVTIKNNGKDNFSFDPEVFSVSEGNKKLSEAAIRADFDTTLVPPSQEVSGTITIFGRPWSDRLAVNLADSGKTIPLRR